MHRVRLVRRLLEDGAIDVGRRAQVTVLLAADRDGHRFADRDVVFW
jgi:hypothetical protein